MIYVGIDPGFSGAIAVIDPGQPTLAHNMPTLKVGKKTHFNEAVLRALFESLAILAAEFSALVVIEKVHSMPKQGVASSFSFGEGYGLLRGMVVMARLPYVLVTPQRWKKAMLDGMGKDKDASRIKAQQLFPEIELGLKKHHGRGDALLLAEYGRLHLSGGSETGNE